MVSGLDLLGSEKSGIDLLEQPQENDQVFTSGLDLLDQLTEAPPEVPKVPEVDPLTIQESKEDFLETPAFKETIQGKMVSEYFKPSMKEISWTDESLHEEAKKVVTQGAKNLGWDIVGTGELAMNLACSMLLFIPSKLYGVMALPFGRTIAEMAEEHIAKLGYQPYTKSGQQAAELVGKGFELFLTPARNVGEEVDKLDPEAGYLAEFGAELAEFIMTGGLVRGATGGLVRGAKAKFKPRPDQARKILDTKHEMEQEVLDQHMKETEGIPDAVVKKAQQEVIKAEKTQADLRHQQALEKFDIEPLIAEELALKAEQIARAKQLKPKVGERELELRKLKREVDVTIKEKGVVIDLHKAPKEPGLKPGDKVIVTPPKVDGVPTQGVTDRLFTELDSIGPTSSLYDWNRTFPNIKKHITETLGKDALKKINNFKNQILNDYVGRGTEYSKKQLEATAFIGGWQHYIDTRPGGRLSKPKLKVIEPITEVDLQIGAREPAGLSAENSPFNETLEHTQIMKKVYAEKGDRITENVEVFTGKLLNDVNRYRHGEKVDIEQVRNGLSELASRAEELRYDFADDPSFPLNFENWKETVSEAAKWSREVSRDHSKIEWTKPLIPKVKPEEAAGPKDAKTVKAEIETKAGEQIAKDLGVKYDGIMGEEIGQPLHLFTDPVTKGTFGSSVLDAKSVAKNLNTLRKRFGEKEVTLRMGIPLDEFGLEIAKQLKKVYGKFKGFLENPIDRSPAVKFRVVGPVREVVEVSTFTRKRGEDAFKGGVEKRVVEGYNVEGYDPLVKEWKVFNTEDTKLGAEQIVKKYNKSIKDMEGLYGDVPSLTLHMGIPLDKAAKDFIAAAKRYKAAFQKDISISRAERKPTLKKGKKVTAEAIWDTKTVARKALLEGQRKKELGPEAYKALQMMVNSAGGHAYGQTLFNQFRKEVYGGYTPEQVRILNQLIRGSRIQDIANYKVARFPKDQGPAEAIAYENFFEFIEEGITPRFKAKLMKSKKAYFDWMRKLIDDLAKDGIITEEMAEGLKKHDYARFKGIGQRIEEGKGGLIEYLYDEKETIKVGGRVRSVNSSGVDTLARGKLTDVLEPDQRLTALEMFNRTYGRVFRNRTFQSLAELAKRNPENPIARLSKGEAHPNQPTIGDARTWTRFTFRENGKRKSLFIDTEFAKGLEAAGQDVSPRGIAWSKNFALAPIARTMLTGAAPLWSLFVNLPRDIMHTYISAGTYEGGKFKQTFSSLPPAFATQLGANYTRAFYDTFFRSYKQKERLGFMRLAERGLLMPFLATQAKLGGSGYRIPGKLAKVEKLWTYIPESLELWTRQAIAERVVGRRANEKGISREEAWKDNEIVDEAVFAARDYLDFNQGGWWIKMQDQLGKIYLNAGTQAARTFFRALKENPQQAMLRVTQTIGIPTVMSVAAARLYAPRTSRDIPPYQDDLNMNIPFPDSMRFTDSTGQEVGLYLSIPLDSGAAFLKNLFQGLTEKFMYESGLTTEEPDYEAILGSLTKFAPDIMSLPPSSRAAFEYMFNIDFWTRRQITQDKFDWPMSAEEYEKGKTSEMAIDVGGVTKLSPKRLERVKRAILGNNIWTYAVGKGYDEMFGDVPEEMKEEHIALVLAEIPGIKRFVKVARPGSGLMDKQTEIINESEFENFVNSRNVDFLAKAAYWHGIEESREELREYLGDKEKVKDRDEFHRLRDRIKFLQGIKELQNRNSWARMWYKSAEDKAKDFVNRMKSAATPEEEDEIRKQLSIVTRAGGYVTDDFRTEVSKLLYSE